MKSSRMINTETPCPAQDFRKRWGRYALALSLTLHIGAALVIIIASGFGRGVKNTKKFIIQDFALTPSISAPAKTLTAPPDQHPSMTSTARTEDQDADIPAQEAASEQPSEPAGSPEKLGGLMSTPLGLGMTHGYFSGLADGRSLRDDIRGYYFEMVEKINREWWEKAGLLKEPLRQDGIFELLIQRDGTVVSIQMVQGTGSSEADRMLADIISKASPLPPLPSTYDLDFFQAPLRIKAPSFLFNLRN